MDLVKLLSALGAGGVLLAVVNGFFARGSVLTKAANTMQDSYSKMLKDFAEQNAKLVDDIETERRARLKLSDELGIERAARKATEQKVDRVAGIIRDFFTTLQIHATIDAVLLGRLDDALARLNEPPSGIVMPPLYPQSAEEFLRPMKVD